MKRLILSLTVLTLALHSQGQTQIGNSDFEQWDNIGTEEVEPTNWNSFMNAVTNFLTSGAKAKQVDRSTDKRPGTSGTYSAKIWSRNVAGIAIANGNLTLGKIYAEGLTASSSSNHNRTITGDANFSESFNDTPDSIVVWLKYLPVNTTAGHKARISCMVHTNTNFKDPNDTTNTSTLKMKATASVAYSGGNWKRISVPFVNVNASLTSAYILVTLSTNNIPGGGSIGDELFIDDLELVYVPKANFTKSASTVCAGTAVNFTNTSTNYPTSYLWDFGDGTTSILQNPSKTYATAGTYNVTLTVTNQWGSTTSTVQTITVNAASNANFFYAQSTFCSDAADQTPTVTNAGTFSAAPTGLSINPTTGVVNVAASTPGSYTITNTVGGACPDTKTTNFVISPVADASFSYSASTYCANEGNQTPTVAQLGTFSASPAGLSINSTTGVVNLATSNPGTYTVTNTIGGACPDTKSVSIEVNAVSNSSFAYPTNTICSSEGDQTPTIQVTGGTFTASSADITVDPATGVIDMDATEDGTYAITYALGGLCPSSTTVSVTITSVPDATFSYGAATFCTGTTNPAPVFEPGANGGVFSSTAGLVINSNSGVIDLTASVPGTYTVVNTIPAVGSCLEVSEEEEITIVASPDASFSYTASTYCANEANPAPVFATGAEAGEFTSTAGLEIDALTGVVDLTTSTAGTYTVTNTISGTCSDVKTASITIKAIPVVTLDAFSDMCIYHEAVVLSGGSPLGGVYSGTGVSSGTFDPAAVTAGTTVTITYSYTDATTSCSNEATSTILVDECLGLEEVVAMNVVAYPNPTTGKISFEGLADATRYVVFAVSGQEVAAGELSSSNNVIDLSAFENGIYVVRLTQTNAQQVIRIVKN